MRKLTHLHREYEESIQVMSLFLDL